MNGCRHTSIQKAWSEVIMNCKFSMKSLGIACLLLIMFVVGTNTPLISRAQSAPPVKRQCGTQVSNPQLNGFFWAFPQQQGSNNVKQLTAGTSKLELKVPVLVLQPQLRRQKGRTARIVGL